LGRALVDVIIAPRRLARRQQDNYSLYVKDDAMRLPPSPRILMTQLTGIGRCLHAVPLLRAVRRAFPGAFIAWAGEEPLRPLVEGHPDLNQFVAVPPAWMKTVRGVASMRARLRTPSFDVAFDPEGLTRTAALGWLSGARIRIGFPSPDASGLAPWLNNRRVQSATVHQVDRNLDLMRGLNIRDANVEFGLPLNSFDYNLVRNQIRKQTQLPFVVIHPGAGLACKRWPPDRYAVVAQFARRRLGLRSIVTWSGAEERAVARAIEHRSANAAIAAPQTSLRQLAALLAQSVMYVGGETGPMHLAAALGIPCVALFGPAQPLQTGPYGPGHQVLQADGQSIGPGERLPSDNFAMRQISVEHVCRAIADVLQRRIQSRVASAS
jgi:ADP-heptose:LPS heptosyltransferase